MCMNVALSELQTRPLRPPQFRMEAQEIELTIQGAINRAWETTLQIQEDTGKAFDISIYGGVAVDLAFNYGALTQPHTDLDLVCFNVTEKEVLKWITTYLGIESPQNIQIIVKPSASREGLTQYRFVDSSGLPHEVGLYQGDKQEFVNNGMNYPILIDLAGNGLAFSYVRNLFFPTMTWVENLLGSEIEDPDLTLSRLVSFIKDLTRWGDETTIRDSVLRIRQYVLSLFNESVSGLTSEERETLKGKIFTLLDYHKERLELEIDDKDEYACIELINRRFDFFQALEYSGLLEVLFPDEYFANFRFIPKGLINDEVYCRYIPIEAGNIFFRLNEELHVHPSQYQLDFALGISFRKLFTTGTTSRTKQSLDDIYYCYEDPFVIGDWDNQAYMRIFLQN